jgi:hypothetical protein
LLPIVLTEAFGCDRCQQIFVLEENGQVIEQLSSTYPYKRAWRWTGYRWIPAHQRFRESYLPLALVILAILLLVWLPLALRSSVSLSIILWIAIVLLLVILPTILFWLAYRR